MLVNLSTQNYQVKNKADARRYPVSSNRGVKNGMQFDTVSFKGSQTAVREGKHFLGDFISFLNKHNPFSVGETIPAAMGKNAKGLKLTPEHFFIKITGYARDMFWAEGMVKTTDEAAYLIEQGAKMDEVLKFITSKLKFYEPDPHKMNRIGVMRASRPGWVSDETLADSARQLCYEHIPYSFYRDRFDAMLQKEEWLVTGSSNAMKDCIKSASVQNPFDDIGVTQIRHEALLYTATDEPVKQGYNVRYINFAHGVYANKALNRVEKIYKKLNKDFRDKSLTGDDLAQINERIAELHWIMTHSMPWGRGTDAAANSFVKAIYKSLGIKTYPPKDGLSFDLEAFCTELKDYKARYASYYEHPPELI